MDTEGYSKLTAPKLMAIHRDQDMQLRFPKIRYLARIHTFLLQFLIIVEIPFVTCEILRCTAVGTQGILRYLRRTTLGETKQQEKMLTIMALTAAARRSASSSWSIPPLLDSVSKTCDIIQEDKLVDNSFRCQLRSVLSMKQIKEHTRVQHMKTFIQNKTTDDNIEKNCCTVQAMFTTIKQSYT